MNKEPRARLPLAGLLIIFVAPLASLMVIVPTLFAGSVQQVERSLPAIIGRLAPNPSPHNAGRPPARGLPPVAAVPHAGTSAASPPVPVGEPSAPAAPPPAPTAAPSPAAPPVLTPTAGTHQNHGRRRRRRPHDLLSD